MKISGAKIKAENDTHAKSTVLVWFVVVWWKPLSQPLNLESMYAYAQGHIKCQKTFLR